MYTPNSKALLIGEQNETIIYKSLTVRAEVYEFYSFLYFILRCEVYDCHTTYSYFLENGNIGIACGYNNESIVLGHIGGMLYWKCKDTNSNILPAIGKLIGWNGLDGKCAITEINVGYEFEYNSSYFLGICIYDQSGRIFKFMDQNIGWKEE